MKRTLAAAMTAALLAGCGGGGDEDPADVYVGTWQGCLQETGGSYRETLVITKTGAERLRADVTQVSYAGSTTCGGTGSAPRTGVATFELQGTKVAQGHTVDKVINTQNGGLRRDIFMISGSTFRFGADGGPVDSEGYPNTLDSQFLTRVN